MATASLATKQAAPGRDVERCCQLGSSAARDAEYAPVAPDQITRVTK